jgi:hypothetical protein
MGLVTSLQAKMQRVNAKAKTWGQGQPRLTPVPQPYGGTVPRK